MKKIPVLFICIFFFFILKRTEAQSLITDSAFIITMYIVDKANSNDSFYTANIYQVINFTAQKKSAKRIERLLLRGSNKKWSENKWLHKLMIDNWIPFVNKLPATSFTVQQVMHAGLRNKLIAYDSTHRYVTGAAVNMTNSFTTKSFIKAYRIYCEGYLDTTDKTELNSIYHGINRSSLTHQATVSEFRKKAKGNEVTTANIPVTVEVSINRLLFNRSPLVLFMEMKGSIITEYRLINIH